jgi:hypothetical protein
MHEPLGKRPSRWLIVWLAILLAASVTGAADLRGFAEKFERNQQELREYRWKTRVEMVLDGRSETVQLFEVNHDPDGMVRKTPVSGGDYTKKASKKQRQLRALQIDLQALIDSYLELDESTAEQYFDQAAVWQGQGRVEGETRLKARHVRRQGDEVSLWLDSETGIPRQLLIVTSASGEPVRVTTRFALLEAGPFYPASVVVETEIKEKKLVMKTEDFDHAR